MSIQRKRQQGVVLVVTLAIATSSLLVPTVVTAADDINAEITAPEGDPAAGDGITFDASGSTSSAQIESYEWRIEPADGTDGETITQTGEQFETTLSEGTYTVELTVEDANGDTDTATRTIDVVQPTTAAFSVSPQSPNLNEEVTLDASPSSSERGDMTYSWSIQSASGDIQQDYSGITQTVTFDEPGEYVISLTVDDGQEQDTETQTINVGGGEPVATFSNFPVSPNGGQEVTLDASNSHGGTGIASYNWTLEVADGEIQRSGEAITHSWDEGLYDVTLTVETEGGQTDTTTRTIAVTNGAVDSTDDNPRIGDTEGAYLLLNNNDAGLGTEDNPNGSAIYTVATGALQMRLADANVPLVRIDNQTFTLDQAETYGQATDTYRETLYLPTRLPRDNSYVNLTSVEIVDARVLNASQNLDGSSPGNIETASTSDGVQIWVRTESEPGWRRVRDATIRSTTVQVDTETGSGTNDDLNDHFRDTGYLITNPQEAEVYSGNPINYTDLNRQTVEEDLLDTGTDTSQIPHSDGEPRYELQTGAIVEGEWQAAQPIVYDHYAAVARIDDGARYADYWLADPAGINVTGIYDFRVEAPPDYETTSSCEYEARNGSTVTGTNRTYEQWEVVNVDHTFRVWHDGTLYETSNNSDYVAEIEDPVDGALVPYSEVQVELRHTYGVESDCPGDSWETTEEFVTTDLYSTTSHQIRTANADDLNVTVYVTNENDRPHVYYGFAGSQRPADNPLDRVVVEGSNASGVRVSTTLRMPWIFIPQSIYDALVPTTDSQDPVEPTSTTDRPNYLYRDYLDANGYRENSNGIHVDLERYEQTQTFEGVDLGSTTRDTTGEIGLYRYVGGDVVMVSEFTDVEAHAVDVFGNRYDVDVVRRDYTEVEMETSITGQNMTGHVETEAGEPVVGETIHLSGAQSQTVTTDGNGNFTAQLADGNVILEAELRRTDPWEEADTYYEDEASTVISTNAVAEIAAAPLVYVGDIISSVMVFANWIALGLFMVWWTKFRDQSMRG